VLSALSPRRSRCITVGRVTQRLDDPFAQLTGSLASASRWQLEVVASTALSTHLRRIELTAEGLGGLDYRPGQDLMLLVAVEGNRPVRRRYTIRSLDRARDLLAIDVVVHGPGVRQSVGPGEQWVLAAAPGTTVEGIAPRGKIFLAENADWHLFAGDESALPMVAVMTATLPAGSSALALLEVPDPADEYPIGGPVTWLPRDGRPAGDAAALVRAVTETPLPAGHGHAYLAGEARVVLALRDALAARGIAPEQISPKAYWGLGRSNASHGEPPRD